MLLINQLLTLEGLLMIVDKVWKLTNTVRVGLDARSSHTQTQSTVPDTVCSYCPPCHGVLLLHYEMTTFLFFLDVLEKLPSIVQNEEEECKIEYGRGCQRQKGQNCLGSSGWEIFE